MQGWWVQTVSNSWRPGFEHSSLVWLHRYAIYNTHNKLYLHFTTWHTMVCRKADINRTISMLQYCVPIQRCTMAWAVLTGQSTGLGFDIAWFSSLSSERLCTASLVFMVQHMCEYIDRQTETDGDRNRQTETERQRQRYIHTYTVFQKFTPTTFMITVCNKNQFK